MANQFGVSLKPIIPNFKLYNTMFQLESGHNLNLMLMPLYGQKNARSADLTNAFFCLKKTWKNSSLGALRRTYIVAFVML
jgi:hypothetical protein